MRELSSIRMVEFCCIQVKCKCDVGKVSLKLYVLSPFMCPWTPGLFTHLGHCGHFSYKHWGNRCPSESSYLYTLDKYLLVQLLDHRVVLFFSSSIWFIWERQHGRGEAEGEGNTPLSREPIAGLHPRPWDHDLSLRQILHWLSHPGAPGSSIFTFWGTSIPFPRVAAQDCNPTNSIRGIHFPHILSNICCFLSS